MAIVGTTYSGTESKWGYAQEGTFGTATADAGQFWQVLGPMPSIDRGILIVNEPQFDGSRVNNDINVRHIDEGQLRVISFSDMLVCREDLGELLYGVCQNVSEGGATAYEKTYTIDETTTQPVFSSDAGYFATVAVFDPIAAYHQKYTSCILRTLTLTADLTGDGLLRASGEWISGFAADTTATLSGTWGYYTQAYYYMNKPTLKQIADVDIVLYGFDLTISNNAVIMSTDSSGNAESYHLPSYSVTGNLKVKYDTAVQGLLADHIAGTDREIQIATGTDGATGNFDFLLPACTFSGYDKDYGEVRGQAINLPFTANRKAAGDLAIITVSDGLDQSW